MCCMADEAKLEQVRLAVDEKLQGTLKTSLEENSKRIQALTEANATKQLELQRTLTAELEKVRQGNEAKLEKMRRPSMKGAGHSTRAPRRIVRTGK